MKNVIVETVNGSFEIIKDESQVFDVADFEAKYVDVIFDKYTYIVGDYSANILRLKGFNEKEDKNNPYTKIPDYLNESCAYGCKFYILKRIKN